MRKGYLLTPILLMTLLIVSAAKPVDASEQSSVNPVIEETVLFTGHPDNPKRPQQPITPLYREPHRSSWALAADNDALVHSKRDQDYTYGFNFTYSGKGATETWLSLDKLLNALNNSIGLDESGIYNHSVEMGWFGFTPEDISLRSPNHTDRPYASLIYLSSSREQIDFSQQVAWASTLTLGVMGLNWAGSFQNTLHEQINATQARGWHNQISYGGELTARYSLARQQYLGRVFGNTEIKSTLHASAGYLTEVSWSLSFRSGKYHTAWSSFNPELASYGERSTYTTNTHALAESYLWGGISFKARAYNAFLQGQFRSSPVSYDADELNPLLMEAWLGYTYAFSHGYRLSYVIRGHTSEIKHGRGDRNLLWGGLILSKSLF